MRILQGLFNSRMAKIRLDLVISAFRAGAEDEARVASEASEPRARPSPAMPANSAFEAR